MNAGWKKGSQALGETFCEKMFLGKKLPRGMSVEDPVNALQIVNQILCTSLDEA